LLDHRDQVLHVGWLVGERLRHDDLVPLIDSDLSIVAPCTKPSPLFWMRLSASVKFRCAFAVGLPSFSLGI
jgi:hypothetical protein